MKLRDIELDNVFVASGALNFFGQGWWYHKFYRFIPGFDFNGATFVSKTTTLNPRQGNIPLKTNLQPKGLKPDCIKIYPCEGLVLNSVGLSTPGASVLLKMNKWQKLQKPFLLSFMTVGATNNERRDETKQFVDLLGEELHNFSTKIGLQINVSCPNTQHDLNELIRDVISQLEIASILNIPLIVKLNVLAALESVKEIANSELCHAIENSNTIPWGELPDKINWQKLFGTTISPLVHLGGGGLSGWPLTSTVTEWISRVRDAGVSIPIIAGGGIGCRMIFGLDFIRHINLLKKAGADAIVFGTAALIRPWKVQGIIKYGNKIFREGR